MGTDTCRHVGFVHKSVKIVAYLPIYTAIVVTITLLIVLFGVPYVGD